MARETAITDEVTYSTQHCHLCGEEVATDASAPADTIEAKGYAVLLGEGELNRKDEYDANWNEEISFQLQKKETRLPTVEGYIVCENCVQLFHELPESIGNYSGGIPRDLKPQSSLFDYSSRTIVYVSIAVVLLVFLLVLIL